MNNKKRIAALCAAVALAAGMAGCQPTPERQAVVNKSGGIPSDALVTQGTQAEEGTSYLDAAEYEVSEHWKEDVVKSDYFIVNADVDVKKPKVAALPVQKLTQRELSQEETDKMIAYFAGEDAEFYEFPRPLSKADFEQDILRLKESLAQVEAGGDGESPESIRSYIAEAERKYAAAPENPEWKKADTKYTFTRDWETGEPKTETGENFISIAIPDGAGGMAMISAQRPGASARAGTNFYYSDSAYTNESSIAWTEKSIAEQEAEIEYYEEPYRSEATEDLRKQRERYETQKALFAQSMVDLDAMKQKAVGVLSDLGITGVQITMCEQALYRAETEEWGSLNYEYKEPDKPGACYVEFRRENGGVPCEAQRGGSWGPGMTMEGMYSSPFYPEQGSILFDETGKIRSFSWNSCMQVTEQVAADSKLISFEEAKNRAIDHLYWNNTYYLGKGETLESMKMKMRYEAEEVKLIMTYINVMNEPDKVMAVPAWYFRMQGYVTYTDPEYVAPGGERETRYNEDEMIINALDGSPVLPPGTAEILREMEEEQKNMGNATAVPA